jgi:hypothetical protein
MAILLPNVTRAMDIVEFDKMTEGDRQAYLDFLVEAAQKVLIGQGREKGAAKVYKLFHGIQHGDFLPPGERLFKQNLDGLCVRDAQRYYQDHTARRVQVEAALLATLKENNIAINTDGVKEVIQMSSAFKPRFPLETIPAL